MSDSGSMVFDNLIAGSQKKLVTRPGTVAAGEVFSRGQVLGRRTTTAKFEELDEGAVASYDIIAIATEDIDATGGDVDTDVFTEGEFSENAVIFAYGDTAADWREILFGHGIYLRSTVSTAGV